MKLKKLILKNFKAYKEDEIDFDDISVIVGKNDAGKSTILQALNLFFNPKDASKTDIFYKNCEKTVNECSIECHFDISSNEIKLGGEDKEVLIAETNLLNKHQHFVLRHKYTETSIGKSPFIAESYVKCHNYDISDVEWSRGKRILEQMNKGELGEAIKTLKITKPDNADGRENHWKRKTLESELINQNKQKTCLEISLEKRDKEERLTPVLEKMPKFRLFSNDKANSMGDKENSTVIANEIKSIIAEQMKPKLEEINKEIQKAMQDKLNKLNYTYKHFFNFLGEDSFTLQDGIPSIDFKTSGIVDSRGLSIENRGSGFRRLALLSLHLSAHKEEEYKDMIFAIEEPETSQNPHNQIGIISAIQKLTDKGSQIIITTHSPSMAKEFDSENIKYSVVENCGMESKSIKFEDNNKMFDKIIELLGVLPFDTHGKNLIVFVEGVHDEVFLSKVAKDIFGQEDILFIPVGGSGNLSGYIAANIFKSLRLPYGGFIDKDKDSMCKSSMIKALEALGYGENSIETELEDITKYLNNFSGNKKAMYNKLKDMDKIDKNNKLKKYEKIDKTHLNKLSEIEEWFKAFDKWKKGSH